MLKEYFVVARYVAQIPEGKDYSESVIKELVNDLRSYHNNDYKLIDSLFSVVEGEEVDMFDETGEENDN
jgi:hypothetical protein